MADRESRDANDPRDQLRAMNKEARAEFEADEADDTGGPARQSRADRDGVPAEKRPVEAATRDITRATREQDDADALRVPSGGDVGGASAEREAGAPLEPPSAAKRE